MLLTDMHLTKYCSKFWILERKCLYKTQHPLGGYWRGCCKENSAITVMQRFVRKEVASFRSARVTNSRFVRTLASQVCLRSISGGGQTLTWASPDHKPSQSPTKSMRPGIWSYFRTWLEIQKILHFHWIMEHTALKKSRTRKYTHRQAFFAAGIWKPFFENLHSQKKHFSLPYGLGWRLTWFVISQG